MDPIHVLKRDLPLEYEANLKMIQRSVFHFSKSYDKYDILQLDISTTFVYKVLSL